jgi:hypothetical protein
MKALLARLLQEADMQLEEDIQTQTEGLDKIVELINYLDFRDGILEDLDQTSRE